VIKVSTYAKVSHIHNEVKYLSRLKRKVKKQVSAYPETIVQYRKSGYGKFSMGGVAVALSFVQLYPFGEPLYFYLLTFCDGKENVQESYWDAIRSIGQGMKEALEFIHKHNICHNDISDKNIGAKNGKPVLVDLEMLLVSMINKLAFMEQLNMLIAMSTKVVGIVRIIMTGQV